MGTGKSRIQRPLSVSTSDIRGLFPRGIPDRHPLEPSTRAEGEIDHAPAHHDRGKDRSEDAQAVHHGETAHRPRAEEEERKPRDQRGDVGVEDGAEGALVARVDRRLRRGAAAQLLAHALVDEDVRVDRHAERERDRGDAREGERGLKHRQQRDEKQQIGTQRERREHPEHYVVGNDEQRQRGEAVNGRVEPLLDVLGAERRSHRAFLYDFHGRGERAGANEERQGIGLFRREQAGDLEAVQELALYLRHRNRFALAPLDEDDGHEMAEIFPRNTQHHAAAGGIQIYRNGRLLMLVERRPSAGEAVPGQENLFFCLHVGHRAVSLAFGEDVHVEGAVGTHRVLVHQPHLERRGAAEYLLRLRGILHSRELHDHAVRSLLLDHGLCDAQLVDAVVQRLDVLLERELLRALLRFRAERGDEAQLAAQAGIGELQVGELLGDERARLVAGLGVAEADHYAVALARDASVTHVLVAQLRTDVASVAIELFSERRAHVHLEQEMHAAPQVEAKIHWPRGYYRNRCEPSGGVRQQIQRDRI